jgi:hypothetical protein
MNRLWKIVIVLAAAMVISAGLSIAVKKKVLEPAMAREQAFAAIEGGELKADANGVIDLPERWRVACVDGKAYVTGSTQYTLWVLFVAEKSKTARLRGYLFCNKPAAARVSGAVTVNYPNPGGGQVDVTVQRVLNPNCFEVVNQQDQRKATTEGW